MRIRDEKISDPDYFPCFLFVVVNITFENCVGNQFLIFSRGSKYKEDVLL